MNLLCFDISSSGITSALLNERLEPGSISYNRWILETDSQDAATLSVESVIEQFNQSIRVLNLPADGRIDAICIGTFLHSCVFLNGTDQPLTPVFTWLDQRGETGLDFIRTRMRDRFHEITGCRYHPMFPVFKVAAMRLSDPELFSRVRHIVSIKRAFLNGLTGTWLEDHGSASASGLFDIHQGEWSRDVLGILGLDQNYLPRISRRTEIIGQVTSSAAADFGLPEGVAVVAGTGDGFLAN